MRQVSIREFRANMAKELTDLPFELVKRGEVLAVVAPGNVYTASQEATECVHTEPKIEAECVHTGKEGPVSGDLVYTKPLLPLPKGKQAKGRYDR